MTSYEIGNLVQLDRYLIEILKLQKMEFQFGELDTNTINHGLLKQQAMYQSNVQELLPSQYVPFPTKCSPFIIPHVQLYDPIVFLQTAPR